MQMHGERETKRPREVEQAARSRIPYATLQGLGLSTSLLVFCPMPCIWENDIVTDRALQDGTEHTDGVARERATDWTGSSAVWARSSARGRSTCGSARKAAWTEAGLGDGRHRESGLWTTV